MTDPKKYYFMQPGINPSQRDQHKILSKANIWAVGAVMWSLTSLGEIQTLSNQTDAILMGIFPLDGVNILQEFEVSVTRNYSPQLLGMIKKCLRMRTQDRPTAEDLFREVFLLRQECLEKETERANRTGDWQPLYLWCTPDELNELGSGDAISDDKDSTFWETFAERLIWVHQGSCLPCPPSAPERLSMNPSWPEALRQRLERRWATAIKHRDERIRPPSSANTESRKRTASEALADPEGLDLDEDKPIQRRPERIML